MGSGATPRKPPASSAWIGRDRIARECFIIGAIFLFELCVVPPAFGDLSRPVNRCVRDEARNETKCCPRIARPPQAGLSLLALKFFAEMPHNKIRENGK